jgi:hypothetical protein
MTAVIDAVAVDLQLCIIKINLNEKITNLDVIGGIYHHSKLYFISNKTLDSACR